MKKILYCSIFLLFIILIFPICSQADSSDLYMNSLDIQAQINNDGSMRVCEYWDIDISETNTLFKDFIIDSSKYSSIDNVIVSQISNNIETPLTSTPNWAYHLEKGTYNASVHNNKFEICWGVGLDNDSTTRLYKVEYTVNNVISKYEDCAELYWQFVGSEFEITIGKITGTVLLPNNADSKDDILVWGHTKALNGTIYATDLNKVKFDVGGLNSGNFMEVRVAFPTKLVNLSTNLKNTYNLNSIIEEETKWANKANAKRIAITSLILVVSVLFDVLLIYGFIKKHKELEEIKKNNPKQDLPYFRDIPDNKSSSAEALRYLKRSVNDFSTEDFARIFSSSILDLCLDGYLTVVPVEKKKVTLKLNKEKDITSYSNKVNTLIYNFIKKACDNNSEIELKTLESYIKKHTSSIIKLKNNIESTSEDILLDKNHVDSKLKSQAEKYTISTIVSVLAIMFSIFAPIIVFSIFFSKICLIGFLILFIISVIKLIQSLIIQSRFSIFTDEGKRLCMEWNGLKRFMEDFSMLDKREVPELPLWEKYLVFATAFNISSKVLKQLKIVYPELENPDIMRNYANLYFITSFNYSYFNSSINNSISTSISSQYSSGGGAGGGFSGGGGFGGGRWWRRRSLIN
ncbi:MAG: DUF2207 domain-containing protein [Clostridia bacterium]|nr:DUF2207 domain-containing protein [Clostridia bacterium]